MKDTRFEELLTAFGEAMFGHARGVVSCQSLDLARCMVVAYFEERTAERDAVTARMREAEEENEQARAAQVVIGQIFTFLYQPDWKKLIEAVREAHDEANAACDNCGYGGSGKKVAAAMQKKSTDEVMPLAQCLGALCDYLKKDTSFALSFNPSNNSFVLVEASCTGVYSASFFAEGSTGRILLEALNNWFAKEGQKS